MEQKIDMDKIKRATCRLQVEYALFWLAGVLLMVIYEGGLWEEGTLAHDGRTAYILQTACVMLTLGLIPFSLKLFKWVLPRRVNGLGGDEAVRAYVRWSEVRLACLTVVVLTGLSVYYWTLSSIGGLCAALGGVAALFCSPGQERMKGELGI